jgi:hypothetical protein
MHIADMSADELDVPESTAVRIELMEVDGPRFSGVSLKRPA